MRGIVGVVGALTAAQVGLLVAAIALTVAWMLLALVARVINQPRSPHAAPATSDLGTEPPAIVNLLVGNFRVRPEAVPATLLDLAARRVGVELEQTQPGQYACRLRPMTGAEPVAPYEGMVLSLLRERASDGVVPAGALTTGQEGESEQWFKRFSRQVVQDAQSRGLSRDLWDKRTLGILYVAAAIPSVPFGLAFGFGPFVVALIGGLGVVGGLAASHRQRDTAEGLAAAGRWLGVRRHLADDPMFPVMPPTAVAVWERYLAYAAAMGLAGGAAAAIPMGAESDGWAWSAFAGPWRQVRVRYPWRNLPPGWGMAPGGAVMLGLLALLAGGGVLFLALRAGWYSGGEGIPDVVVKGVRSVQVVGFVVASVAMLWGAWVLVSGLFDLGRPAEVRGRVLRLRNRGSSDHPRYFAAVDPGEVGSIRAWRVSAVQYGSLDQGEDVRAVVTGSLGHVRSIERIS
jgi:Predicted membrane protein (DUF2207)